MYIFINVLVFSSFFLFNRPSINLFYLFIYFLYYLFYIHYFILLNDNSYIIIFLSLASIIIISIYEKFLFYKNMNEPLISILINCYNSEKFIYECLTSAINQTYKI